MTGLRVAARLARREVRHRPWRTLMVAFLVALPVAAMTFAAVMVRTDSRTALTEWQLRYGTADIAYSGGLRAPLPPGSREVTYQVEPRLVRTTDGRRRFTEISNMPVADPLFAPTIRIRGRAPEAPHEVLLGPETARRFGVGIGDTLDLDKPIDATVTVVGIGERRDWFDANFLVLHPSVPLPARAAGTARTRHLVDFPDGISAAAVAQWATEASFTEDLSPAYRTDLNFTDGASSGIRWTWVAGAVALTVMGIVIASAFAAGARRQLTTLGQLAANGSPPNVLRRVLVLQGSWTGAVGAILGLGLGAAALAALTPHRDRLLGRYVDAYDVNLTDLVPIVVLGVLAATVAAVVPARSASRVPVMAALAGRRPLGAVPRWLTVVGLLVSGGGLGLLALAMFGGKDSSSGGDGVWAFTAILGAVALLLGVCALAPGYVSVLTPAAARLGGSWRLAVRSLARQRTRTAGVVSAVCATAALMLAWSAIINSSAANSERTGMQPDRVDIFNLSGKPVSPQAQPAVPTNLQPPSPEFVARVRDVLDGAEVLQLQWVPAPGGGISIADEAFLEALGIGAGDRRVLARDGVAVLAEAGSSDPQRVTITSSDGSPVTVTAPVIERIRSWWERIPPILVTPQRAAALGLVARPGDVVLRQPSPLTTDQRDGMEAVFEDWIDEHAPLFQPVGSGPVAVPVIEYARPDGGPDPFVLDAILAGVSLLFVVFVVASSLGLAAAETRDERDVLTVVGASPRLIRRTSGVKALVLTLFGVALAIPVGLLPVLLFSRIQEKLPFGFPWRAVGLLLVAVPAAAGLLTMGGSALALRLRPVRTSTMAFE